MRHIADMFFGKLGIRGQRKHLAAGALRLGELSLLVSKLLEALLLVALLASGGCTPPCEALANQVCSCKPNSAEQNACKEQVRAATGQHNVSAAENSYCSSLLDKCKCDAIDKNDIYACGLAKPPAAK